MNHTLTHIVGALALIASAAGSNAHAQATIDQTKALAGNVTPGDTPGFPITISVQGSYKLTGNLVVPAGYSGIELTAEGVTLDLNGFSISGPGQCTRDNGSYNVYCLVVASTGDRGVDFKAAGSTLRNGRIRGFQTGVWYRGGDHLENLHLQHNFNGISSYSSYGARTLIRGVRAELNRDYGIAAYDALIQESTAASNGKDGFTLYRSMVLDSAAYKNKGAGLRGGSVGRVIASGNMAGNIESAISMGGNLEGSVPF